jgi:hypothetical protein
MLKKIVFDFSNVLLFAKDHGYQGKLNDLHGKLKVVDGYEPQQYFEINTELIEFLSEYQNEYVFCIFTAAKMHTLPSLQR